MVQLMALSRCSMDGSTVASSSSVACIKSTPKELSKFTASSGDYMWMNSNWYQTHQLQNVSDDFCATLNCYSYNGEDHVHYPEFDYVKDGQLGNFKPNSDMEFCEMREIVYKEKEEAERIKKEND